MASVVPEDWMSAVIVPLYEGKGERTECKKYRGISLLSVVGIIYAGILVDRVRRVNVGLIDDEQGGFTTGRRYIDQIFTLKQIGEKIKRKNAECIWVLSIWRSTIGLIGKLCGKCCECMMWGVNF